MAEIINNEQCSKLLFDEVRHLKLWRGRPKYLPEEVVAKALSLHKNGKSYPQIAEELGFSRAQVHNTLTREKLSDTTMRFISNHGDAEFIKTMILELRSEKNWKARLTKNQAEIMLNQHAVESLYSATYVEDYLDSMENLPDDVMKQLTKMKEMDVHFQKYLNDLESQMKILLDSQDPKKESSSKLRLQNVLMSAQDKGDEKLQIVQQVQDFVDNKVRQLELDEKNLDVFITEFGKEHIEHDSRNDSKVMDHSDRPSKRARRARHDVYVPSILGPSTLEATSFSDSIRPGMNIESRHIHHNTSSKSIDHHSSSTHHTSVHHNTSTPAKSSSVVVTTPIKSNAASANNSSVSHAASDVQTSPHNETAANSNKSNSNISNSVIDEKPTYNPSSSSSGTTTNPTSGSSQSTTPKKRDQQQKKEVQEKKHKRRKAKQSDNSPPNIPIDPDEPTYCLCDQVSYGEMIGCDNDLCPIEWFHFSCVQLTTKPKGKWYCPKCRGDRPNVMKPKAIFLKELEKYNREKEEKS